jgi:hypothetical protein
MDIDDLLQELEDRAIKLHPYLGRLRATGETLRLTEGLKIELARHKLELQVRLGQRLTPPLLLKDQLSEAIGHTVVGKDLEAVVGDIHDAHKQGLLNQIEVDMLVQAVADRRQQIPHSVEDMPLSELAQSGVAREVLPEELGETVLWAADNAVVTDAAGKVVYRADELKKMVVFSQDELQQIHTVKREFDGELVEPDEHSIQISVRALLEDTRDQNTCFACGQSKWWTKESGERMCQVCHPDPRGRSTRRCRR